MKKLILVVLLVSIVRGVIAADWPRWRGVNHDDISTETGLLQSWPSKGPKRIWSVSYTHLTLPTILLV